VQKLETELRTISASVATKNQEIDALNKAVAVEAEASKVSSIQRGKKRSAPILISGYLWGFA
jgi:hypothetical protein